MTEFGWSRKASRVLILSIVFIISLTFTLLPTVPAYAQDSGIISTVAGSGESGNLGGGYSGDGGTATLAQLKYPREMAFDSNGNMYIVDQDNNRIRKVDTSGFISTVAGNGTAGYSGDGGTATLAQLKYPNGVAFDSNGNMYIADQGNYRIRKVDKSGIISTVVGTGTSGYLGDGGTATLAQLKYPREVAFDSNGNMYIADNIFIRKVDTSGKISTIAGKSINGFSGYHPYLGDGGPAISAEICCSGLAIDSNGNIYIADSWNHRIHKVDSSGIITTVTGNGVGGFGGTGGYSGDGGPAIEAQLNTPNGVAFDSSGNMYIADSNNNCIRKIDSSGKISTVAGNGSPGFAGDSGSAIAAQLFFPLKVAFDTSGNMYITDLLNHRIRKVLLDNKSSETWADYTTTRQKSSKEAWTITFNKEVDSTSVIIDNIYVATDDAATNKVDGISVRPVNGNARQVTVSPPSSGWQSGGTYYLFISGQVKSASGEQTLKSGIRMKFIVTQ